MYKKVVTIVGARPQFIKAAAVSRKLRILFNEVLIHTGQHYDENMSDIFFRELQIPRPDYNLNVGSGSHARQTADMMVGIENILINEKPDYVLVYGDTNSTLAGALAAVKLHIPIIHVEAGLRSYNMNMPEEINRILTDRISEVLFCPTMTAEENLKNEGRSKGVYMIGDVMCDAVLYYRDLLTNVSSEKYWEKLQPIDKKKITAAKTWYLTTVHRAENTDSPFKLKQILKALNKIDDIVIFPVHPRISGIISEIREEQAYENIYFVEPLGYNEMLYFTEKAVKVVTDSGGLQKEAYLLNTPCITVREQTEWIETLNGNHNVLAEADSNDILDKIYNTVIDEKLHPNYYGEGKAADEICRIISEL